MLANNESSNKKSTASLKMNEIISNNKKMLKEKELITKLSSAQ